MRSRLVTVLLLALALVAPVPAFAAETVLTVVPRAPGYAGDLVPLDITLTADGVPVPDVAVEVQRRIDGVWTTLGTTTTGADGTAVRAVRLWKDPADNVFRARAADGASAGPVSVSLLRRGQHRGVVGAGHGQGRRFRDADGSVGGRHG